VNLDLAHDAGRLVDELPEQIECLRPEVHRLAVACQLPPIGVERETSESHHHHESLENLSSLPQAARDLKRL
jgi:hypothetical protein